MKVKGEGKKEGLVGLEEKRLEIAETFNNIQKSDHLLRNLDLFIASIYMKSRKILEERMRVVCCLYYGKGEHPEGEVVEIVKVVTRGHEETPQAHSMYLNRGRDPQPESQAALKPASSFSPVGSPFRW